MFSGFVKPVETERFIDRSYKPLCNRKPSNLSKTCQKDVKNLVGWLRFSAFDCKKYLMKLPVYHFTFCLFEGNSPLITRDEPRIKFGLIVLMRSMWFDVVRWGSMCSMWFDVFDEFHEFDVVR